MTQEGRRKQALRDKAKKQFAKVGIVAGSAMGLAAWFYLLLDLD